MFVSVTKMFSSAFNSVSAFLRLPWTQKKEVMRELIAKIVDMLLTTYSYLLKIIESVIASLNWLMNEAKEKFKNGRVKKLALIHANKLFGDLIKQCKNTQTLADLEKFKDSDTYVQAAVEDNNEVTDIKIFKDISSDKELCRHVNRTGEGMMVLTR